MMLVASLAISVAAATGLLIKFLLRSEKMKITWKEFSVVTACMAAIFIPSTLSIGRALSVADIVSYEQFVNGVEVRANDTVVECQAGKPGQSASSGRSNCSHSYVSGRYSWEEMYTELVCTTDSKGYQTCTSVIRYRTETANLYTPYATTEHTYSIDSAFGGDLTDTFTFAGHYLDENPVAYSDRPIPGNIPRGAPNDWKDAKQRLQAGDPRAVTKLMAYDNFILASQDPMLTSHSEDQQRFLQAGLIPQHTRNINGDPISGDSKSLAEKVSFVGINPTDDALWQASVMRFNAALGPQLQGDLHVVVVNSNVVSMADAVPYLAAVKANWTSTDYGKRAIAKNGIILVLGVSAQKVEWAEATTGMPFGNELMQQYIRDTLPGTLLDPVTIFGTPRTTIVDGKATVSHTDGVLEKIMFEDAKFQRARMTCNDDTCVGYKDLVKTIDPKPWQQTVMVIVTSVIALLFWVLVAVTSIVDRALLGVVSLLRHRPTYR